MSDDRVLAAVRSKLDRDDPCPARVPDDGHAAYGYRSVDGVRAKLVFDSLVDRGPVPAGVRPPAGWRMLAFALPSGHLFLYSKDDPWDRTLTGTVTARQHAEVLVQHATGAISGVTSGSGGHFTAEPLAAGPFRILIRGAANAPDDVVMTDWLVV